MLNRVLFAAALACCALALPAAAQPSAPSPSQQTPVSTFCWNGSAVVMCSAGTPASVVPLGYCQLSVTTAVLISTCSGGIPAAATLAYVTPETAAVRWRDDGVAPTTTVGYPVTTNAQLTYSGNLAALRVVAQSGAAVVNIAFYRY
jgi:hypothetical protein